MRCAKRRKIIAACVYLISYLIGYVFADCPNACSGHGYCDPDEYYKCICFEKYSGPDCSQRICPSGRAWFDYPSSDGTAHAKFTECSNMGYCDRDTGECVCRAGFMGEACQRMACKNSTNSNGVTEECGGRGRCLTMREAAYQADYEKLWNAGLNYAEWDADQIQGCICDAGFTGFACDLRECPAGADPFEDGVDEVQVMDCKCPYPCSGELTITYEGYTTYPIPYYATSEYLEKSLEDLPSINQVIVNMTSSKNSTVCGGDQDGTATSITFLTEHGNLKSISVDYDDLQSGSGSPVVVNVSTDGAASSLYPGIVYSRKGTKVNVECSDHGICDTDTGSCECHDYFSSSDGMGNSGNIADCGYWDTASYFSRDTSNGSCPITKGVWFADEDVALECSGKGNCTGYNNTCACNDGYAGPACELMECPLGHAWFDEAQTNSSSYGMNSTAHDSGVVCSGMGTCDYETGECTCETTFELFDGDNCGLLTCYTNNTDYDCSGAGECLNMRQLAAYGRDTYGDPANYKYEDPWDADMIQGCQCQRSPSVDNQDVAPGGNALTYRGPFAFADTDYIGYACDRMSCATGDNPMTTGQTNEIQRITCQANTGVFKITFRNETSGEISANATAAEFEAVLEDMLVLSDVTVTFRFNDSDYMCSRSLLAKSMIDVEFITEHGDLPLMTVDTNALFHNITHVPTFTIQEIQRGTKENVECSSRGHCAQDVGQCICLPGYNSSDGSDAPGERGDCGFRNPYATQMYFEEGMERLQNSEE